LIDLEKDLKTHFERMWKLLGEFGDLRNPNSFGAYKELKTKNFLFRQTDDEMDSSQITVSKDGIDVLYLNMYSSSYNIKSSLLSNEKEKMMVANFTFEEFFNSLSIKEADKIEEIVHKKVNIYKWLKKEIINFKELI